jgi:hypothetical protein
LLNFLYHTRHYRMCAGGDIQIPTLTRCKPAIDPELFVKNRGHSAWSDSSFTARSQAGWAVMYMNMAICWASRKIKVAVTSSTQAEMVAGVGAAKDINYTRMILHFMWAPIDGPTPLFIDNEGMWNNVRNEMQSQLTRHWETWYQLVREYCTNLALSVHKVEGTDECADIFTKPIPKEDSNYKRFSKFVMNRLDKDDD